jgi:nitroreductase
MDLKEAIYTRRSVREFDDRQVDDGTIRDLIDAAVQAPSAINQQGWSFCAVRDRELLGQISQKAKAYMLETLGADGSSHHLRQLLNDERFDIFYHAPLLIVIAETVAETPWAVEDCALAAQNLMLAAHGAGLGSCWIGFSQAWLGTPEGKTALKLPLSYRPVAPIIVGYPKSKLAFVPRKDPEIRFL